MLFRVTWRSSEMSFSGAVEYRVLDSICSVGDDFLYRYCGVKGYHINAAWIS